MKNLIREVKDLATEVKNLKSGGGNDGKNSPSDVVDILMEIEKEKEELERKKANVVILGLKENDDASAAEAQDKTFATKLVRGALNDETATFDQNVSAIFRMGYKTFRDGSPKKFPRLLKIKFKSQELQ